MGTVHSVLVLIPCLSVISTACIKNELLSSLLPRKSISMFCLRLTKRGSSLCLQWWMKVSLTFFSPSALTAHLAWRPLVAVGGERHFLSFIFHLYTAALILLQHFNWAREEMQLFRVGTFSWFQSWWQRASSQILHPEEKFFWINTNSCSLVLVILVEGEAILKAVCVFLHLFSK